MRQPNIPKPLKNALEQYGLESVQTVLFSATVNRELPDALKHIPDPTEDRKNAFAWLEWKAARNAFRNRVIIVATVIAAVAAVVGAVAAVIAAIFSYLALK